MRYFIGRDNSGHYYLVEASYRDDWNCWINTDEKVDPDFAWTTPIYAQEIGCGLSNIEFSDPRKHV